MIEDNPQFGHTFHPDQPAEPEDEPRFGQIIHPVRLGAGSKLFGRYDLARELGRGGMAVVWLAWDERVERNVALKFLPEMVAGDPAAIADLKKETRRGQKLKHTNIVATYDFIRSENEGLAAIAMEYVDGSSLSHLRSKTDRGLFQSTEILPWLQQIADALTYAHE